MSTKTKTKRYHFSLGNSTDGPVGFCAAVVAESEETALARLKTLLPDAHPADDFARDDMTEDEYIRVYFNDEAITVADIDEVG